MNARTLRIEDEKAAMLEVIARTDGISVNEVINNAIDAHIDQRRANEEFLERLRQRHEDERRLYELGQS